VDYEPNAQELPIDFPGVMEKKPPAKLWRGRGCPRCHNSGYRGRLGIFELMLSSDLIKDLVTQRVNANTIRAEALKAGMITLRKDGWRKVLQGTTTIDEVARVTAGDIS
jgi:general secretion pathway protein E/type IV pilus assembly protein PilB